MLTVSQCSHALSGSTNRGKKHNIRFESKNINVVFFFFSLLFFFFFFFFFFFCNNVPPECLFLVLTVFVVLFSVTTPAVNCHLGLSLFFCLFPPFHCPSSLFPLQLRFNTVTASVKLTWFRCIFISVHFVTLFVYAYLLLCFFFSKHLFFFFFFFWLFKLFYLFSAFNYVATFFFFFFINRYDFVCVFTHIFIYICSYVCLCACVCVA